MEKLSWQPFLIVSQLNYKPKKNINNIKEHILQLSQDPFLVAVHGLQKIIVAISKGLVDF